MGERHTISGFFLRVRKKFSEDPNFSTSYWPELGHMLISEIITDKRYRIILIPVCPILNLRVELGSLRDNGYIE